MGHVINAKAMRLGWSTIWSDQWYSEIQYYSEYLHAIFRIRYYLIYIFTRKHFDKKAIFYSHFEIIKYYKNLYIEIYLYSGKLETDYEDYKFNFFYRLYNMEKNKDPETREPLFLYTALKLVLIFDWLHFFSCNSLTIKDLLAFMIFLRKYDIKSIKQYLTKLSYKKYINIPKGQELKKIERQKKVKKLIFGYINKNNYKFFIKNNKKIYKKNVNLINKYKIINETHKLTIKKNKKKIFIFSKSDIFFFILLFTTFISAKVYISKASIWKQPNRNITLRRFYMAAAGYKEMSKQLYPFARILSFSFEKLTKFSKVFINFFLTNNNCVNAKFLSRFIARKLAQNYPVRELLNPIRKELLYVIAIGRRGSKSYNLSIKKNYLTNINNLIFKRSIFKLLISSLFILYNKHLLIYFNKFKIWFNLELIIIYLWFNNKIINKNYLINITEKYFRNKCGYICFFDYKLSSKRLKHLFIPKIKQLYIFSQKEKYIGLFDIIYNYIYSSKLSFFDMIYFEIFSKSSTIYLRSLNINFNRYLKFNYWQYNYMWLINDFNMNHMKSRIKIHTKLNGLKGYKMHLRGRFTRKQRAASYWFSKGKVPLNTINSYIDYSFFTIPLSNSAVTVKVWLYKSDDLSNTYYLKIF